jgi:hypothetical protein
LTTSLLDGALKKKIAAAFKGRLTKGTVRREVAAGLNSFGDPTTPTVSTFSFEGVRQSFSLFTKASSGIPETDVAIVVLLGSLKPDTSLKKDDKIFLAVPWNTWHQVRKVLEIDPANAACRLQCYEIPAP